ncbi:MULTISPECIES: hypothetical protein [unclassified Streptomyces]|uniref:hypothetical protein n=1 Tax=unclassified Streptomyces TaxID=2593676 RepID=UPI00296754E0|nr:hypothetical protein [Streptomyces sp. SJL17-1]
MASRPKQAPFSGASISSRRTLAVAPAVMIAPSPRTSIVSPSITLVTTTVVGPGAGR